MASSNKLSFFLLVLVHSLLFHSHQVLCIGPDDDLFKELNNFRQSLKLPKFKKNNDAKCLADALAIELEDQQCPDADDYPIEPGNGQKFTCFNKLIKHCSINITTTTDAIIWPSCVIKNYTGSRYTKYLSNSNYTGVGVGSDEEDCWNIVVLTTDTPTGKFSGAAALVANGMVRHMAAILLGLFFVMPS